jgi:hypothetical protein
MYRGARQWFAPFPSELTTAELIELFRDCADRAEYLRREGARVVLVTGCELTLFNPYRDTSNARSFRADLRKQFRQGKPVVATEYGCCPYVGAAD